MAYTEQTVVVNRRQGRNGNFLFQLAGRPNQIAVCTFKVQTPDEEVEAKRSLLRLANWTGVITTVEVRGLLGRKTKRRGYCVTDLGLGPVVERAK